MTKLRLIRRKHRLSQLQLGYLANVQPSDLSRMETGRLVPYPSQLERLARVLQCENPEDLLKPVQLEPLEAA